jgi:hypothetical protein
MTEHQPPTPELQYAVFDAAGHAARLVRAVGWLTVLTVPGTEARPSARLLSDEQLARLQEQARAEQAERAASAMPASPAPARLDAIAAVVDAVRVVRRIVHNVAAAAPYRFGLGVQLDDLVHALDYVAGGGDPAPSWAVDGAGAAYRRCSLIEVRDHDVVDQVVRQLGMAADTASEVAGIRTDRIMPFPGGSCPACHRRSLRIDATLADERYWTVTCISEACRCTGSGCGCRQGVRVEDRHHAWSYGELDGPNGLHRAIAAALRRNPVRSGVAGHGGWSDRRVAR